MKTNVQVLLQSAYESVTYKLTGNIENPCGYCWNSKSNCECETYYDPKSDPFLTIPVMEAKYA